MIDLGEALWLNITRIERLIAAEKLSPFTLQITPMDSSESFICACGFFARAETDNMCYRCYHRKLRTAKTTPMSKDVLKSSKIEESVAEEPNAQRVPKKSSITETKTRLEDVLQDLKTFVTAEESDTKSYRNVIIDDATSWVEGVLQNWTIADTSEESKTRTVIVVDAVEPTSDNEIVVGVVETTPPPDVRQERCDVCKKRLSLTSIECRCKHKFCDTHRYSEEHTCSYDYKTEGRKALAKRLKRIVAKKIQRID